MSEPGKPPAPSADAPATDAQPAGDQLLGARLRRAGVAGCAALLLGATALTGVGTAGPSTAKLTGSAFVQASLRLEADVTEEPESFGLGGGVVLVSESVATLKAATGDVMSGTTMSGTTTQAEAPVCASSPVAPGSYRLTSPYGFRTHPIFGTYTMHTGNDYAAPLGTPIHAVTDGTVVYTGAGRLGRSSELVIIEHTVEDTTFYSWYVHMYPDGIFVEPGQQVRAGEVIAEVGNNGNSTGPHLHFEIHTSDAGLGLRKNAPARTLTALTGDVTPSPTDEPGEEPTPDPTEPGEEPTPDPTEPGAEPTPDPTEPGAEPTPDPTEPGAEPTPDPTEPGAEPTPDPTEPGAEPTPDPTEPGAEPTPDPTEPGAEPTPDPTEPGAEPTPDPTEPGAEPTPDPTEPAEEPTPDPTEPGAEPTPDPTEPGEESEDSTDDPADETPRPRHPFPTRAYGTTVDPVAFLASLGLTMVAPSQCTAS
ncbi:peptidoglycan DD-metalloendopeptidase family protein [Georgenia sp. H159]|uniref:peptidoglycan DD-metalloendopeptidase family protein n=1 Tax=Georgenia sp. H159 TaxID=3076115 RepID=UPI002D77E8C3|nr:peptidoglycan DD-metalloendopeptidase family protein [Georgenia sp. H159]